MNDQPGIVLSQGQYGALSDHLGALTMEAVCSVARARELEAENAQLRAAVTQARMDAQHWEKECTRQHEIAGAARQTIKELQDVIAGKAPLKPARNRRKAPE